MRKIDHIFSIEKTHFPGKQTFFDILPQPKKARKSLTYQKKKR